MFDILPQKIEKTSKNSEALWPERGNLFELNIFYKMYETCGGKMGEGFIYFWSAKEITEYEPLRIEMYPSTWMIFGSDGGGTYFGFTENENKVFFFSCDPIDPTASVTWLGSWSEFTQHISEGNYV